MGARCGSKASGKPVLLLALRSERFTQKSYLVEQAARLVLSLAGIERPDRPVARGEPRDDPPSWCRAARRFSDNSREGLAARVLDSLTRVRISSERGDTDLALGELITLGALVFQMETKVASHLRGKSNVEMQYGTDTHRAVRAAKIADLYRSEMSRKPRPQKGEAEKAVAKQLRVSARTVRRVLHLKNKK